MEDSVNPKPEPNTGPEAPSSAGAEPDWQPTISAPTTPGQPSNMGHNSAQSMPSSEWATPPVAPPQKTAPPQDNPPTDQADREPKKELNVRDALGYLDAVKVTFQDNPDVYNHFLDIMKDFKSQVIDTPGVIERVSNLFNGHPSLIQGFNTFLPPGYRIECSMDPHDHNITVTTPTGTTTQTTTGQRNGTSASAPTSSSQQGFGGDRPHTQGSGVSSPAPGQQGQFPGPPMQGLSASNAANYGSPGLAAPRPVTPLVAPFQPMSPGLPGSANAASVLGGMQRAGDPSNSTDGNTAEFNRAIQYVNKIKTRFSHDPDTYKQFLEILHIFQKDQREYRDVHSQVQHLFKTAPDLLDEFKQFLPAIGGGGQSGGLFGMMAAAGNQDGWPQSGGDKDKLDKGSRKKDIPPPAPPAAPPKRKKRVLEKGDAVVKPGASKKPKHHHSKEPGSPQFGSYHNPGSPGHHHASLPQPFIPSSNVMNNPDDQAFFERVKKSFDHRETYDEFLKLLNLFAHDVIDTKTLVDKATPFLGEGTELLMHFKSILDWDDRLDRQDLDMPPTSMVRNSFATMRAPKAEMSSRNGPSYRRLPASEAHVACSGRDEMCKSVLNDEWVSHPTWASEESGFVAHKKNQYEDALHKSEEERHEYDFHIEAIVRTISILEPINAKILQMSAEDRALFKLKPGLGGQSKSIHQRIIKKVYGRDAGLEVIQALHDCPAVAVPVVLSRLKQKEEEWKRAQREWNKVWREVDARNFFKALDHQGVMFKANDKKAITSKALVAAIETRREESIQKRSSLVDPLAHRTKAKHHMEFVIDDTGVLQDVLKLVFSFLDRTQGQISYSERQKIEKFLRSFVPLFFLFDPVQFDRSFSAPGPTATHAVDGSTASRSVPGSESGSVVDETEDLTSPRSSKRNGNANGVQAGDLRKRLLKSAQEGKANSKAPPSRASPGGAEPMQIDDPTDDAIGAGGEASAMSVNNIWVHHEGTSDASNAQPRKSVRKAMFYANTTFYALLRLLEILYSRLLMCKKIASELAGHQDGSYLVNPIAVELGLHDTQGPGGTLAVEGSRNPAVHFYDHMLDCCEKLFDNEMDQGSFEENMRYMFGSKAYKMFTYDKVVGALIKQVQTILGDNRCQDLLTQLQREREVEAPTAQQWINYRRQAENIIGPDEHMFRFNWDKHSMTIQLLSKDDPSLEDVETMTERWKQYISSYVLTHQTEGIPRVRPPFLKRTVFDSDDSVIARPGLEIKVCVRTYRLFFVAHSEDFMWRPALGAAGDLEQQRAARFGEWMSRNEPR